jgi:hypothetical protein
LFGAEACVVSITLATMLLLLLLQALHDSIVPHLSVLSRKRGGQAVLMLQQLYAQQLHRAVAAADAAQAHCTHTAVSAEHHQIRYAVLLCSSCMRRSAVAAAGTAQAHCIHTQPH